MKKSSVLVTGGAGFIGSHIVEKSISEHKVIVVDRRQPKQKQHRSDVLYYSIDLNDLSSLSAILADHRPTAIHHCAGHTQLREAIESPVKDAHDNVMGTLSLIQALLQLQQTTNYRPESVIFSSSAAIYGGYEVPPFSEALPPRPVNPYGVAKTASEHYFQWYSQFSGVPVTIFRYANVYGPRQSTAGQAGAIAKFLDTLAKKEVIKIYGQGDHQRDYIFVGDVAQAHLQAAHQRAQGIYNLGTGQPTSTRQLAELCIKLEPAAEPHQSIPLTSVEQASSWMDVSKAKKELNWEAKTSLADGLQQTYTWYKQHSQI